MTGPGAASGRPADPLPIDSMLPEVGRAVAEHGVVLLAAPPGSGKTTRVPPALANVLDDGEIVVLEPRKLPARAAAARVAAELGGRIGGFVGYQVRGDRRVSSATRIRFVTEGVLVRQLVRDPFLPGVAAVVLDEFHERHVEGDLALAMLREVRETVRPDLRLCVMSATLDSGPLAAFLPGAVELEGDGQLFPVEVEHESKRVDERLELRVRRATEQAVVATSGDILVFLPGVAEIERCAAAMANLAARHDLLIMPLHGRLPPQEQDAVLRPADRRKLVLATNVAESSLTIPGVTAVIDSGLCRELRHDRGRGVDVLELARISQASATQRSGRAGRTGPGRCYRLWTAGEERGMAARGVAELMRVDLAAPALLVRAFAGREPQSFGWLESPPASGLAAADALLADLGALAGGDKAVTERGRDLLSMPMHPRLGCVVLEGRRRGVPRLAATAAMLLADVEELGRGAGVDLEHAAASLLLAEERGFPPHLCREASLSPGLARRLCSNRERLLDRSAASDKASDEFELARCLLAGFPDRVAMRANRDASEAVMVGGRGLQLSPAADGHDLILALRLRETGRQQRSSATVTVAITETLLHDLGLLEHRDDAQLEESQGRVVAVRSLCYRDLALRSSRGGQVPPERARELLLPVLGRDPFRWLGEQKELRRLLTRCAFLRDRMPELEFGEQDDAELAAMAIDMLGEGGSLRSLAGLRMADLLLAQLTQAQRSALARQAPDRVPLPSGRSAVIDYGAAAGPTIRARMQEFFGLGSVAALASGRVPVVLELLAPNQRPVQVTTDLASFWANVYPKVRRELQRRYPRHTWPEDPMAAAPEARPPRRRRS